MLTQLSHPDVLGQALFELDLGETSNFALHRGLSLLLVLQCLETSRDRNNFNHLILLHTKLKIFKLQEENIKEYFHDFGVEKTSLKTFLNVKYWYNGAHQNSKLNGSRNHYNIKRQTVG